MVDHLISQDVLKGVSIIVIKRNRADSIERLLKSFLGKNTYRPVEFIIVHQNPEEDISSVISEYAKDVFIRLVRRTNHSSFAESNNFASKKARFPYLLFLHDDIIYTADALPIAVEKLTDPGIGVVGICLDDDPENLTTGQEPRVQHAGITFEFDNDNEFHRPILVSHNSIAEAKEIKDGFYPAVSGAFMLCSKADFEAIHGFCEEYDSGFEDIDYCLRLGLELDRKCFCLNELALHHSEGATHELTPGELKTSRQQNNYAVFNKRMGEHVKRLKSGAHVLKSSSLPRQHFLSSETIPATLNILFVLYQGIDSNGGLHAQLHADRLMAQGAECLFALPREEKQDKTDKIADLRERTFTEIEKDGLSFTDGRGPDIIHAWTPREIVRVFCEKLLEKNPCPLIIHMEDNEEYLTEVTVGRPLAELAKLSEKELDSIIPSDRYHPVKGRNFLANAQGITLTIETLGRFNHANVPSLVLPPPVDERLFYPRPLNMALRKELKISDDQVALAHTGNVHADNRDVVRELYRAVHLLNEQGCPAVLIRTGISGKELGSKDWITAHERNFGWVERHRMPNILAAADILVQPGESGQFNDQGVPFKLAEFFAMGRPVILAKTNLGLHPEHLKEAYVLEKVDAEEITKAVKKICEDTALKETLTVEAMFFYRNMLYQPSTAKDLIGLYDQLKEKGKA